jgi:hypothetical protein
MEHSVGFHAGEYNKITGRGIVGIWMMVGLVLGTAVACVCDGGEWRWLMAEERVLPVVGYGETARAEVSAWTMVLFGWAVVEFGAAVCYVLEVGRVIWIGAYAEGMMGSVCLLAPVGFVVAAGNCVRHFEQRRSRWAWMPVCSVVLMGVSPLVPVVAGAVWVLRR